MFSKFLNLKPEKQERILDAAIKEFAQKGFDNASTNEIIKEAEISKGLLFHYFNSKKNLYLFLYDHCIDLCLNEFYKKINLDERDIFIRLRQALLIKLELLNKYSNIFLFLEVAYTEKPSVIKNNIDNRKEDLIASNYMKFFENIDISKFRENTDIKRALNIIIWTLDGFSAQVQKQERKQGKLLTLDKIDYENAFAEADVYIDVLKNCFYK